MFRKFTDEGKNFLLIFRGKRFCNKRDCLCSQLYLNVNEDSLEFAGRVKLNCERASKLYLVLRALALAYWWLFVTAHLDDFSRFKQSAKEIPDDKKMDHESSTIDACWDE